ncbi:hypothetical protein CFP56_000686 [Quercus suber]|uniref:Uncharacterized protein n=1 Tax=Quercus suber TaxID=58331 RepID=A0AAW0LG90_QUESU
MEAKTQRHSLKFVSNKISSILVEQTAIDKIQMTRGISRGDVADNGERSASARWRWLDGDKNPPIIPVTKKNPNKSKSNNGKKKAQEKESEEKLAVATATELDGFTMGSYAEFVGGFVVLIWELGCCDGERCYISDTVLFCSADLAKKKHVEKVKVSVVDAKINELQSSLKALTRRVVGLDVLGITQSIYGGQMTWTMVVYSKDVLLLYYPIQKDALSKLTMTWTINVRKGLNEFPIISEIQNILIQSYSLLRPPICHDFSFRFLKFRI